MCYAWPTYIQHNNIATTLHVVSSVGPLIPEVRAWLIPDLLMLMIQTTDALVSPIHRPLIDFWPVQVGNDFILHSSTVRNMGVIFDTSMTI